MVEGHKDWNEGKETGINGVYAGIKGQRLESYDRIGITNQRKSHQSKTARIGT